MSSISLISDQSPHQQNISPVSDPSQSDADTLTRLANTSLQQSHLPLVRGQKRKAEQQLNSTGHLSSKRTRNDEAQSGMMNLLKVAQLFHRNESSDNEDELSDQRTITDDEIASVASEPTSVGDENKESLQTRNPSDVYKKKPNQYRLYIKERIRDGNPTHVLAASFTRQLWVASNSDIQEFNKIYDQEIGKLNNYFKNTEHLDKFKKFAEKTAQHKEFAIDKRNKNQDIDWSQLLTQKRRPQKRRFQYGVLGNHLIVMGFEEKKIYQLLYLIKNIMHTPFPANREMRNNKRATSLADRTIASIDPSIDASEKIKKIQLVFTHILQDPKEKGAPFNSHVPDSEWLIKTAAGIMAERWDLPMNDLIQDLPFANSAAAI